MSQFQIPLTGDTPNQTVQTTLDGIDLTLQFQWNAREGYWYIHLLDEQEVQTFAVGRKLVLEYPLLEDWLPGYLFARLEGGLERLPRDLTRMRLIYVDAEERAAG